MSTTGRLVRSVAELVIEKLDLNRITAGDARKFLKDNYGITVQGRSREDVANNIIQLLREQRNAQTANFPQQSLFLEVVN